SQSHAVAVAGGAAGVVVRSRAANGDFVAAGSGHHRHVLRLLLLSPGPRPQDRTFGHGPLSAVLEAVAHWRSRAAGARRYADRAVWAEGRRRGPASRSDVGAGRPQVFVWPRVGDVGLGAAASVVGSDRAAPARADVREEEGHAEVGGALPLDLSNEAAVGWRAGDVGCE